ncbi:MAG: helix-turn-helix domain-containing protein [Methanomassiliicoccus sp.]|nr:helix-turn-helix domain-containing protein [Methanomassiliicoccus sp.]
MNYRTAQRIFVDERSTKIMMAALYRPRTALEIWRITGIPVAKLFSRLKVLERKGLVKRVAVTYAIDGREMPLFQSMLHDAFLFTERGKLKITFKLESCGQKDYTVDTGTLL